MLILTDSSNTSASVLWEQDDRVLLSEPLCDGEMLSVQERPGHYGIFTLTVLSEKAALRATNGAFSTSTLETSVEKSLDRTISLL